jgi:hypothetical protein
MSTELETEYGEADEECRHRAVKCWGQQTQEYGSGDRKSLKQNVQVEKGKDSIRKMGIHVLHKHLRRHKSTFDSLYSC